MLEWYALNRRRFPWREDAAELYVQVVSEVLLQRTRAESVARFFPRFISRFPSWQALSEAEDCELEVFLRPIGLWRRRASSLKKLSVEMAKRDGIFPESRQEIETLSNVGQYVANAICMFSHGTAKPLLDSNMARLLERFFGTRVLADIRHDPYLQGLSARVVQHQSPKVVNWAILDFASAICQVRPKCGLCPLRTRCKFYKETPNQEPQA